MIALPTVPTTPHYEPGSVFRYGYCNVSWVGVLAVGTERVVLCSRGATWTSPLRTWESWLRGLTFAPAQSPHCIARTAR